MLIKLLTKFLVVMLIVPAPYAQKLSLSSTVWNRRWKAV